MEHERIVGYVKLAGVELRQNIMDVEDYRRSQKFGHDCGEHQEIRNRMHMEELVFLRKLATPDKQGGRQQEPHDAEKICQGSALVDFPGLNAEDIHAIQNRTSRLAGPPQCDNVNAVTTFDQSCGVLLDACIRFVKRVHKHADFEGLMM